MLRTRSLPLFFVLLWVSGCAAAEPPACQSTRVQEAGRHEWAALRLAQMDSLDLARRRGTAAYEAAAARAKGRLAAYRAEYDRRITAAAGADSALFCREDSTGN